ncbi:hypothetical protein [Acinetobacter dispersus]|uniref:hypothetical protein n=1 Tax=Acinetobacter dispersus TaxID=70348 RepID=UPI00132EEFA4|nr:hypothetical protein [Acinetobacter dispersus]QHH99217.1 hypothetical protein FPL17_17385 [Acinetobacter dispersus]
MSNQLFNQQNVATVTIQIGAIYFNVQRFQPLEINLNELQRLFHEVSDQITYNRPVIDTTIKINASLKVVYDLLHNSTGVDNKERYLKNLFDTAIAFSKILKENNDIDERDKTLKMIHKVPNDIYEIYFYPRLNANFWFELKLYFWLKKNNKIESRQRYSSMSTEEEIFTDEFLEDFFNNNKWIVIDTLIELERNYKKYNGGYDIINPLNLIEFREVWDMGNQLKGLKFEDVN